MNYINIMHEIKHTYQNCFKFWNKPRELRLKMQVIFLGISVASENNLNFKVR